MARPRATETDTVLDAAVRQLTAHGIAATTIDDVAEEAGVSRATVYRYVGGKPEIVGAVILREATLILERAGERVRSAPTVFEAIAGAVAEVLAGVEAHPLLARLTTVDLVDTLPYLTVDSVPLVSSGVSMLAPAFRTAPSFDVADGQIGDAIEEAGRFVFAHLTTPRVDGDRPTPEDAGRRAARLIVALATPDRP